MNPNEHNFAQEKHEIVFPFTGRYFTIGDKSKSSQTWFVLHGYGQLAEFFIRKFVPLVAHNIYVVAPEGLSRFYLEDIASRSRSGNNRVGATWMTREERLTDIKNYINFLNTVYETEKPAADTAVTIFGFSQGAATASRWAVTDVPHFNRLILWGGMLPPDLDIPNGTKALRNKETIFVSGKNDPFLKDERFGQMDQLAVSFSITPRTIQYEGGHDIDERVLVSLV